MITREQADKIIGDFFEKHFKGEPGCYDKPKFLWKTDGMYGYSFGRGKSPISPDDPETESVYGVYEDDGSIDAGGM
ncbi:MAG: hypothetical protein ILO10_02870 [Kiritimatiellae bacterium]|nr:hypothetical protein [Kiritimatiellia bacterium]